MLKLPGNHKNILYNIIIYPGKVHCIQTQTLIANYPDQASEVALFVLDWFGLVWFWFFSRSQVFPIIPDKHCGQKIGTDKEWLHIFPIFSYIFIQLQYSITQERQCTPMCMHVVCCLFYSTNLSDSSLYNRFSSPLALCVKCECE